MIVNGSIDKTFRVGGDIARAVCPNGHYAIYTTEPALSAGGMHISGTAVSTGIADANGEFSDDVALDGNYWVATRASESCPWTIEKRHNCCPEPAPEICDVGGLCSFDQSANKSIAYLGDSWVNNQLISNQLTPALNATPETILGYSGSTAPQMDSNVAWEPLLTSADPALTVLILGVNDAWQSVAPSVFKAHIKSIMGILLFYKKFFQNV